MAVIPNNEPYVQVSGGVVKIFFDHQLHLRIPLYGFVGLQTWHETDTNYWCIELTFDKGAQITTEYDTIDKFASVLELLDKTLG